MFRNALMLQIELGRPVEELERVPAFSSFYCSFLAECGPISGDVRFDSKSPRPPIRSGTGRSAFRKWATASPLFLLLLLLLTAFVFRNRPAGSSFRSRRLRRPSPQFVRFHHRSGEVARLLVHSDDHEDARRVPVGLLGAGRGDARRICGL